MRSSLAVLTFVAVLVFVAGSAFANGITVNGDKSDWVDLGLVHTDNITNSGTSYFQISSYGATVIGDTFYAMLETTQPVANFDKAWPGAWINADQNTGTVLANVPTTADGTDILFEWDLDPWDPGLNYWGLGDDVDTIIGLVTGGASAKAGYVFEWSVPFSDIQSTVAGLDDGVSGSFPWSVCIGGAGIPDGGNDYTRSFGGPITVVPEPGTLALLACGLISLLCYAWRKRK